MRRFKTVECARIASAGGLHDGAKRGYRVTGIKKKKNDRATQKGELGCHFHRGPRATTVKRRNFRNSTSRRLSLALHRAMTRLQNLSRGIEREEAGGGENRGNEGPPWSFPVNFLQLMKEHTRFLLPFPARQNT